MIALRIRSVVHIKRHGAAMRATALTLGSLRS
jgi:hypothetical protein